MTRDQLRLNQVEFNDQINRIRRRHPIEADKLMMNRYKLERHIEALELRLIKEAIK